MKVPATSTTYLRSTSFDITGRFTDPVTKRRWMSVAGTMCQGDSGSPLLVRISNVLREAAVLTNAGCGSTGTYVEVGWINLAGWKLKDNDDTHAFAVLPAGATIAAGGYYIVEDLIPAAPLALRLAIKVSASLVLAWASFNLIEKRCLKLKARFESPVRGSAR